MGRKVKAVKPEKPAPEFSKSAIKPPSVLRGLALEVWKETLPELELAGIAQQVGANALACYCQSVADFHLAQMEIDRDGMTVVTERGMTKHPAVTIKNQAIQMIHKFATCFGLTPASRGKVKMKEKPEANEFDPATI